MTEKIYQRDPYCREITARITGKELRDGRFRVRLERTIFCPEGGGQPADRGAINDVPVLGLASEDDDIIHILERDPGPGEACLRLDFARRYDHMQQHTAQHLLSQVLVRLFDAPTLSFAIGPDHSSIEIGRAEFKQEETLLLESECARLIFANLPVRIFESDDLSALQLRKPPKRQGKIRVVEIQDLDQSACGGTHLKSSAEIGLLKVVKTERVRANIRLYYAAGYRALRDYQLKHEVVQRLQRAVTLPLAEIPLGVEALRQEGMNCAGPLKKRSAASWKERAWPRAGGNSSWSSGNSAGSKSPRCVFSPLPSSTAAGMCWPTRNPLKSTSSSAAAAGTSICTRSAAASSPCSPAGAAAVKT